MSTLCVLTCARHGNAVHDSSGSCLTCALEDIAVTHGGKARDFYLKPDPKTTPASLIRSRARYQRLRKDIQLARASGHSSTKHSTHAPGSTHRQMEAAQIFKACGSQSETARRMGMSRAGAHGLLKRAGVI